MRKNKLIIISIILIVIFCLGFNYIYAYYTNKVEKVNKFKAGEIEVLVTEPNYEDNQVVKPIGEIKKDPTFKNTGTISTYIRAQIYVPVSKNLKYVDNNENIVVPSEEIELLSYNTNSGWELVTEDGFSGSYEDTDGNRYNVYTYKFMENGIEKIVKPNETIDKTLFDKVKIINYLDMDTTVNFKLYVSAIAVQSDGDTAENMWTYYKNQNGTGIVGVK